jgi:hypothetical protein
VSGRERLAADSTYTRAGAAILDAPLGDPAFVRAESSLLRAFDAMPALEPSAGAGTATPRIFEIRTYESHSDRAALNKLAMFNAGEIPIFRRTGLTPVFFGETVVGAKMPNLTYMLTFKDMPARDAAWAAFSQDPDWKALSGDPQYRENVSAISDIILRAPCSPCVVDQAAACLATSRAGRAGALSAPTGAADPPHNSGRGRFDPASARSSPPCPPQGGVEPCGLESPSHPRSSSSSPRAAIPPRSSARPHPRPRRSTMVAYQRSSGS